MGLACHRDIVRLPTHAHTCFTSASSHTAHLSLASHARPPEVYHLGASHDPAPAPAASERPHTSHSVVHPPPALQAAPTLHALTHLSIHTATPQHSHASAFTHLSIHMATSCSPHTATPAHHLCACAPSHMYVHSPHTATPAHHLCATQPSFALEAPAQESH